MKRLKGMHDIYFPESYYFKFIEQKAEELFKNFGFTEIRTPILEDVSVFMRSVGEETDIVSKEMYNFKDRDGKHVCLRPENTASIVRAYLENNMQENPDLKKIFYIGPMFRRERPQKGRYRQFNQIGAEIFGRSDPSSDTELLKYLEFFFRSFAIKDIFTEINSLGCSKCRPSYRKELISFLNSINNLCEECTIRKKTNPLRVLDCKKEPCQKSFQKAPSPTSYLCDECHDHYEKLKKYLTISNINFKENKFLVRGLDYYTKTVFEVKSQSLGAQNTLCGGGRYDSLFELMGGPVTPSVGFSIGLERLVIILQESNFFKSKIPCLTDIFVAAMGEHAKEFILPHIFSLMEKGIKTHYDFSKDNLKKLMKLSDKLGAKFTLIIGEEELNNKKLVLRNMETKEQNEISFNQVVQEIQNIII